MIISAIILSVILILVIAYFILGYVFYAFALKPKHKKGDENSKENPDKKVWSRENEDMKVWRDKAILWGKSHPFTHWHLKSFDGLKLSANCYETEDGNNRWAIVVHGYGSSADKMMGFISPFVNRGFNVLAPDCRGHGRSGGDFIGMGWYDRLDIVGWINKIIVKDPEAEIVLYGISMGGATVMMTRGEDLPENVKCVIEDCGYTTIWNEFAYQLRQTFNQPEFPVLFAASSVCKIRNKFGFRDGSSIKQIAKGGAPILFIHGMEDTYVPYASMNILYTAACGKKDFLSVPDAHHAESGIINPKLYYDKIDEFLNIHMPKAK